MYLQQYREIDEDTRYREMKCHLCGRAQIWNQIQQIILTILYINI